MIAAFRRLLNRRRAYRSTFLMDDGRPNPQAEIVLADLKRFCRAQTSTVTINPITKSVDPMAMAMAEGRREVWNRLQSFLNISDKELSEISEPTE